MKKHILMSVVLGALASYLLEHLWFLLSLYLEKFAYNLTIQTQIDYTRVIQYLYYIVSFGVYLVGPWVAIIYYRRQSSKIS